MGTPNPGTRTRQVATQNQNFELFDVLGRFARVVTFDVSVKNTIEVQLEAPLLHTKTTPN